jgi:CxxC-x17-CxxC domain-containing protein
MAGADKTLTCRECSGQFVFTAGEQEFYRSRGLLNEPGRCPTCRSNRRQARGGRSDRSERQMYPAVCATCGAETQVPFQPRQDRPVYCSDCFAKTKRT